MNFVPYEFPKTLDGEFMALQTEDRILFTRREQLGLTQQQLSEISHVTLRQIQRLEAGTSTLADCPMSTGLALCAALLLDPYFLIPTQVEQPDAESIRPAPTLDYNIPDVPELKKRHGRKPIRRDIMTVYFNHPHYSILIPREVLESMGQPDFIKLLWNKEQHRVLFQGHTASDAPIPQADLENWFDVPRHLYESNCTALVFPASELMDETQQALSWDDYVYSVECRNVKDKDDTTYVLCDLNTAAASDSIHGPFVVP